jgi:hypothetical protein
MPRIQQLPEPRFYAEWCATGFTPGKPEVLVPLAMHGGLVVVCAGPRQAREEPASWAAPRVPSFGLPARTA